MKVAILQWCQEVDRGEGTIERISTTASDCVKFLARQMEVLGYSEILASTNGQVHTLNPSEDDWDLMRSLEELRERVQMYLDEDSLGQIHILASKTTFDGRTSHKWWKIAFRNLH